MKSEYKRKKIAELRTLCISKGLDTNGQKEELITRLEDYDQTFSNIDSFRQTTTAERVNDEKLTFGTKAVDQSMDTSNYFLLLKSANVANYFNFGYIYPLALEESDIYKNENRSFDILSLFEEYIVIHKATNVKINEDEVAIELVLYGLNVTEYASTGLFYINEPIPVSRVKSIYFTNASKRETFLSSIKTFPDSFIPSSICKIFPLMGSVEDFDYASIKLPSNDSLINWKNILTTVDKLFGLFAFIKNVGILNSEKESQLEEYTTSFIGALNIINPISTFSEFKENTFLKPVIQYQNVEITNAHRQVFKSIVERIYLNQEFNLRVAVNVLESVLSSSNIRVDEANEIKEQLYLFEQLDKLLISYKGVISKDVIKKHLPTLALLFLSKFPNKSRQNTDKQAIRISFIENEFSFATNTAEYILGILGLYYGYKNMVKEDTNLNFRDKVFSRLASPIQSIKFRLESYFERFIVESIFRFATKQTPLNDKFEFLNWGNELKSDRESFNLDSEDYEYTDKSFMLLGHNILRIVRIDKTEKLFEKIQLEYPDSIQDTSYLFTFFKKYFRIDKWYFLELLKKNKGRYPKEELERILEIDKANRKRNDTR
jgi:hypothetical protein